MNKPNCMAVGCVNAQESPAKAVGGSRGRLDHAETDAAIPNGVCAVATFMLERLPV